MKTILLLVLTASVSALAQESSVEALTQSCVHDREAFFGCKEQFVGQMIALRAKHQARIAEAGKTAEGLANLKKEALAEIAEDGAGPLAPRQAKCRQMAEHAVAKGLDAQSAEVDARAACDAIGDCDARLACLMPIYERLMFKK
jgi:ethanolamine ammonia-lyase small subunit